MQDLRRPEITGPEWAKMTPSERISRCHGFAREAKQLAQAAHPELEKEYLDIAAQWNTLAAEMENDLRLSLR